MYIETHHADASVVICLLWDLDEFAKFVVHNDRRSKTSFSYNKTARSPAIGLTSDGAKIIIFGEKTKKTWKKVMTGQTKENSFGNFSRLNRDFLLIKSGRAVMCIGNFPSVKQSFAARRTMICRVANNHLTGGK